MDFSNPFGYLQIIVAMLYLYPLSLCVLRMLTVLKSSPKLMTMYCPCLANPICTCQSDHRLG